MYLFNFKCIYLHCISTVFIALVFVCEFYRVESNFLLFNTCTIKFIRENFILKEGHVILGK